MADNEYQAKFRCSNCGEIFEKAVQKGHPATGMGGNCPNCGIKDGSAGVGNFLVMRKNEEMFAVSDPRQILHG